MLNDGTCYGKLITQGKRKGRYSRHVGVAREACIEHHGPPPFKGAICRHLCVNDTNIIKRTGIDDFVCINPDHIEWNTYSQNSLDAADNGWKKYIPKPPKPRLPRTPKPRHNCQTPTHKKKMSDKYQNKTPEQKAEIAAKISATMKAKRKARYGQEREYTTPKPVGEPRSDVGKKHVMSDKPRKQRSDKGVSRTTPRKKNSVIRSNKGKKNVMSDKPRKERSDIGKKRGPHKLKTGTSND